MNDLQIREKAPDMTKPIADGIEINVSPGLTLDHNPGCGVTIYKKNGKGKSVYLTLTAPEFRTLHRAMAAAEPFICDAGQKQE